MDAWLLKMFLFSYLGALSGLFWPILIAIFRSGQAAIYRWIGADDKSVLGRQARGIPVFLKYVLWVFVFLLAAFIIAGVAAALGFAAFLQDEKVRVTMQTLGALAYFSAFTYGFGSASLVGEATKR